MEIIDRLPATVAATGRRKSAHYNDINDGLFTKPVRIGRRAVGWPRSETQAIVAARISGATDDEIRALVRRLEAARKARIADESNGEVRALVAVLEAERIATSREGTS